MKRTALSLTLALNLAFAWGCSRSSAPAPKPAADPAAGTVSFEVRDENGARSFSKVTPIDKTSYATANAGNNKLELKNGHVFANGKDGGELKNGDEVLLEKDGRLLVNGQERPTK